ncbi:MAG: GNAT family N-acetyltransferase [Candidatus Lokiarchaeota archaeon]|nr:GNAT family N-acetyltransferase [Candidatus Lokiarchaeota archaeon]
MKTNNTFSEEELIIRNYRTSDYKATLEILQQLDDKYDIGLDKNKWKKFSGIRQFKQNLRRITVILELKETGEVIGMGMIEAEKDSLGRFIGYMNNWAVKKDYIGKGVGKILGDKAIKILELWGCESIRINIGYGYSEKLINIFSKAGFKPKIIVLEKRLNQK